MASKSKDDSSQALRAALLPWSVIAALIGVGLIVADYFVKNVYVSVGFMSLSSAAISIAGALLITEWVIKPLYVRDVIQVANLSAEIHAQHLRYLRTSQGVPWHELLAGSSAITAATSNENLFRSGIWTAIMEASRLAPREVRVHVSNTLGRAFGDSLEQQWRHNGCGVSGSKLSVVPHESVTQGLIISCGSWMAATVADDPFNDNPPFLVFSLQGSEPMTEALRRGIDRLNSSTTPPIAGA